MFIWPTTTKRITSYFRPPHRPNHNGIDIAEVGTHQIFAAAAGTVTRSYRSDSYGECIFILHSINGQTWETVYAHMRSGSRRVSVGQKVSRGQTIGIMGNTGNSTGQHLHFELHRGRWNANKTNAVDPLNYLNQGGSSSSIENIQRTLNSRYNTGLAVDGIYGPATKKGLIKGLQTELNKQYGAKLTVDGVWGPKTKNAVVTVRHGARGNITWILQAALTCRGYNTDGVDGIFGNGTLNAVKAFQRDNKLTVDGAAGKATFEKLFA